MWLLKEVSLKGCIKMRGGLTNIYTYLWLVVDARQPGILDGPNSLPK